MREDEFDLQSRRNFGRRLDIGSSLVERGGIARIVEVRGGVLAEFFRELGGGRFGRFLARGGRCLHILTHRGYRGNMNGEVGTIRRGGKTYTPLGEGCERTPLAKRK